jgi:DNA-binding MarR family transcriptional regulator
MKKMSDNSQPEASNSDAAAFKLWRLLNHTVFLIIRSREKELAQYGVNLGQAYVLDILHTKHGSATIQDIVAITLLQHHSISTTLNRMALQGLIKKTKRTSDARQYNVIITPKGEALFNKITRNSITDIFSSLSERDQKGLYIKLKKLVVKAYKVLGKKRHPNIFID